MNQADAFRSIYGDEPITGIPALPSQEMRDRAQLCCWLREYDPEADWAGEPTGLSLRAIARIVGCSHTMVANYLRMAEPDLA